MLPLESTFQTEFESINVLSCSKNILKWPEIAFLVKNINFEDTFISPKENEVWSKFQLLASKYKFWPLCIFELKYITTIRYGGLWPPTSSSSGGDLGALWSPKYSIVKCNIIQCSAVQCSAVQCSAVQYSTEL